MLTEKLNDMAYDVSSHIEEALACLEDIKNEWHRGEEIDTSLLSVMKDDLQIAMHVANKMVICLKYVGEYMKTAEEILNDNY